MPELFRIGCTAGLRLYGKYKSWVHLRACQLFRVLGEGAFGLLLFCSFGLFSEFFAIDVSKQGQSVKEM